MWLLSRDVRLHLPEILLPCSQTTCLPSRAVWTPDVDALALHYGLSSDQVFVGVGSDDVLSVAFLTFFNSEKPIFHPPPRQTPGCVLRYPL